MRFHQFPKSPPCLAVAHLVYFLGHVRSWDDTLLHQPLYIYLADIVRVDAEGFDPTFRPVTKLKHKKGTFLWVAIDRFLASAERFVERLAFVAVQ